MTNCVRVHVTLDAPAARSNQDIRRIHSFIAATGNMPPHLSALRPGRRGVTVPVQPANISGGMLLRPHQLKG